MANAATVDHAKHGGGQDHFVMQLKHHTDCSVALPESSDLVQWMHLHVILSSSVENDVDVHSWQDMSSRIDRLCVRTSCNCAKSLCLAAQRIAPPAR